MTATCGCPTGPALTISNPKRHASFHALVVEQGGPAGAVNVATLRAARGMAETISPGKTSSRPRAQRASSSWDAREDSTWIDKL